MAQLVQPVDHSTARMASSLQVRALEGAGNRGVVLKSPEIHRVVGRIPVVAY